MLECTLAECRDDERPDADRTELERTLLVSLSAAELLGVAVAMA